MKYFCIYSFLLFLGITIQCSTHPSHAVEEYDDLYFNSEDKKRIHRNKHKQQQDKISHAKSNTEIYWTVKASTSNRQILIYGLPDELDNLSSILKDSFALFSKEQNIRIEFRFNNTTAAFNETIKVRDTKKFITDHFQILSNCDKYDFPYPNWGFPIVTKTETVADIDNNYAIQGKGCIMMRGVDNNRDGYIISLSKYFQNIYGNNSGIDTKLNSTSDKTWIFFYLNGTGKAEDYLQLRFREGSPAYGQELYKYDIHLGFNGWKQFAIKYSDIIPSDSEWKTLTNTQETKIKNPKELMSIEYALMTDKAGGQAITYLDKLMVIFDK